jgi:hypothetical protein
LHRSAPRASRNPNHRAQFRRLWIKSGMPKGSVADLCRLGPRHHAPYPRPRLECNPNGCLELFASAGRRFPCGSTKGIGAQFDAHLLKKTCFGVCAMAYRAPVSP